MTSMEAWKQVDGFNNYEVSTFGNVRNAKTKKNRKFNLYDGYYRIGLWSNEKKLVSHAVHRLVAQTFIINPDNKETVNHKDKNKTNNSITNLEWATTIEQNVHKNATLPKNEFGHGKGARCVIRLHPETNEILEEYTSVTLAGKWCFDNKLTTIVEYNDITKNRLLSRICAVCGGKEKRKTAFGFIWNYKKEIDNTLEIWKPLIPELLNGSIGYSISNMGRVKSSTGRIIKTVLMNRYNYVNILEKKYTLHRLVALTFIPNPENKEQVNHKDKNKQNNNVSNLEWSSPSENNLHRDRSGEHKIIQYNLDMNEVNRFYSLNEAEENTTIGSKSISKCCRGLTESVKGFIFKYIEKVPA